MTTSSANNSVFRGFFEKQKLTRPNFIDWYRQLRIVLSIEDKLNYLEQPLPPVPVAPEGQQVTPEIIAAHTAWIKGSKETAGLMLMTMELKIQRNLENLHAYEMLQELKTLFAQQAETLEEELSQYFVELLKRKRKAASGAWASRKLKPGALSLYVGNGQREAVKKVLYLTVKQHRDRQARLDFASLMHVRLGHISKKSIEKLHHDGLLIQMTLGLLNVRSYTSSIDTSLNHEEDDLEIDEPQSDIIPICRSTRTRRPINRICLYIDVEEHELGDLGEPANYKAALLDPESDKWLNAINVEIQSIKDNEVWDLVELPHNGKTVGSKWLFKKKTDMDGAVHTYKARLVAKGCTQTPGIDYGETFSLVADIRAIRILIATAANYDYEI
ncbi:retrotransposon protein, putative, ty1-copia subclass [Tanacetum coccineum]